MLQVYRLVSVHFLDVDTREMVKSVRFRLHHLHWCSFHADTAVRDAQEKAGPSTGETELGIQPVEDEGFDFYACPASNDLDLFFSYHPQQPPKKGCVSIKPKMALWENSLYCTVCLAYAKPSASESAFVKGGMKAWKHVHQRIEEHERNQVHRDSAEAYFMKANQADMASHHRSDKGHWKCGLSYRGTHFEAAYTWENMALDHGNFLEMILLLSKFDVSLQEHVSKCIKKSESLNETGAKGR